MQRVHSRKSVEGRWFRGAEVPITVIRRFSADVAREFKPDKILLFGSHARGTPHADSDVDILVVMPARNQLDQAVRIELACDPPFPLDLIVRTPHNARERIADGDSFLNTIMNEGKVLYEKANARVGPQGGKRLSRRQKAVSRKRTVA